MAQIIMVRMKRTNPSGIVCNSDRPIVIWGETVSQETIDSLETALRDAQQLYGNQSFVKTQSDLIREVCDALFPRQWDFVSQGGTIEF